MTNLSKYRYLHDQEILSHNGGKFIQTANVFDMIMEKYFLIPVYFFHANNQHQLSTSSQTLNVRHQLVISNLVKRVVSCRLSNHLCRSVDLENLQLVITRDVAMDVEIQNPSTNGDFSDSVISKNQYIQICDCVISSDWGFNTKKIYNNKETRKTI